MRMDRKKPGKKLENGVVAVRRVNLTLDVTTIAILEAAGAENVSAGVRHVARCWMQSQRPLDAQPVSP